MNGYHPDGNKGPTWLDRLYVALVCAVLIAACGLMVGECAAVVARMVQ